MGDCEFCRIVRGEAAAHVVSDTVETMAFFPLAPAIKGHTLVIPKKHVPDIWLLDDHLASVVTLSVLVVARAIKRALQPDGLNIINSNGAAASQTVSHLHVHLVPRWRGDNFGDIWPASEPMDSEAAGELASVIRKCF